VLVSKTFRYDVGSNSKPPEVNETYEEALTKSAMFMKMLQTFQKHSLLTITGLCHSHN
jgi:hypothetical protein